MYYLTLDSKVIKKCETELEAEYWYLILSAENRKVVIVKSSRSLK